MRLDINKQFEIKTWELSGSKLYGEKSDKMFNNF